MIDVCRISIFSFEGRLGRPHGRPNFGLGSLRGSHDLVLGGHLFGGLGAALTNIYATIPSIPKWGVSGTSRDSRSTPYYIAH